LGKLYCGLQLTKLEDILKIVMAMGAGSQFLQILFASITNGSVYVLVAIGINIIYNATGVINFAHGPLVMLGAMIAASLVSSEGIPLFFAFIISVAITAAVGALLEFCGIRSMRKPSIANLVIMTLGAGIIIEGVAMVIWGKEAFSLPSFFGDESINIMGAALHPQAICILTVAIIIIAILTAYYKFTISGKAMLACSINRDMARLLGIKASRISILSFVIGGAIGAAAGILIAPITLTAYYQGLWWILKGFTASIMGGLGNIAGAIIGGFLLGFLESFSSGYISSGSKDIIVFIVLLLVLYVRPKGILGEIEREY
jgi:branched-chain amino acid transport system permease protein